MTITNRRDMTISWTARNFPPLLYLGRSQATKFSKARHLVMALYKVRQSGQPGACEVFAIVGNTG